MFSNERLYFLSTMRDKNYHDRVYISKMIIKPLFFHFYFLNRIFLFTIRSPGLKLCNLVDNKNLDKKVSQILFFCPGFACMSKIGKLFPFFKLNFLDSIK